MPFTLLGRWGENRATAAKFARERKISPRHACRAIARQHNEHMKRSIERMAGEQRDALCLAGETHAGRRAVIAFIRGSDTRWWGGSIDDWQPDEARLSSRAALEPYLKLLRDFKSGRLPTGHAVMAYKDGSFASVMLGVQTCGEVEALLAQTMEIVRKRVVFAWLKA